MWLTASRIVMSMEGRAGRSETKYHSTCIRRYIHTYKDALPKTFLQIALYSRPAHSARIYPTSISPSAYCPKPGPGRGKKSEKYEGEARFSGVVEHDVGSLLQPMGTLARGQHHYRSRGKSVSGLRSQIRSYAWRRWAYRFSNFSMLRSANGPQSGSTRRPQLRWPLIV